MTGMSEDEGDDDSVHDTADLATKTGESRSDREAKIRKMMDKPDDEMEDAQPEAGVEPAVSQDQTDDTEPAGQEDKRGEPQMDEEAGPARRKRVRGRRKKTVKTTTKDGGYLGKLDLSVASSDMHRY